MGKNFQKSSPMFFGSQGYSNPSTKMILRITITGLCLALALVLRLMGFLIPIAGVASMRFTLDGIFIMIIAMLFGPVYGGVAGGLVDILNFAIKPQGAYLPWLTLTAIAWGVLRGVSWHVVAKRSVKGLRNFVKILFGILVMLGIFNLVFVNYYPKLAWSKFILAAEDASWMILYAPLIVGLLGLIGVYSERFLFRSETEQATDTLNGEFIRIFVAIFISGCIMNSVNTYVLFQSYYATSIGLFAYWIPRVAMETAVSIVSAYVITFLYPLFTKLRVVK